MKEFRAIAFASVIQGDFMEAVAQADCINAGELTAAETPRGVEIQHGEYTYKQPLFDSEEYEPLTGEVVVADNGLVGLSPDSGSGPSAYELFEKVNDESEGFKAVKPSYTVDSSQRFFKQYGLKPYGASFSEQQRTGRYEMLDATNAEKEAKQRAMYGSAEGGDDLVMQIVKECLSDGMYVTSMDLEVEKAEYKWSFNAPMRVSGIESSEWDVECGGYLVDLMTELWTGDVDAEPYTEDELAVA